MSTENLLTILDPDQPDQPFPNANSALKDPDGLLAVGGCLSSIRLVKAYSQGIFPWFSTEEPILWWSPDPRLILYPDDLIVSRSLNKTLHRKHFTVTFDNAFADVISACSELRTAQEGTWITEEMKTAYLSLHQQGIAHSVEAWSGCELVGGLYGLAIGQAFFGESMFHRQTDASKVAFVTLIEHLKAWNYQLIDCQVRTDHLVSLGATEIPRADFLLQLENLCQSPAHELAWKTFPDK